MTNGYGGRLAKWYKRWWARTDWDSLDLSMRELDSDIVMREHAVEGLGYCQDLQFPVSTRSLIQGLQ